jgi:hypothetical protein
MSMIQSNTLWFEKGVAVASSGSPITYPWYNAEALNAGQFFLKYTGTSNVKIDLHLSPADALGHMGIAPADCYEEIAALASGANNNEGFFVPTAGGPFDFPFKSFRVVMTLSADLTICYFALCHNALGGG